jgi:hypothetical protein
MDRKLQRSEAAGKQGISPIIIALPGAEYELINMIDRLAESPVDFNV